MELFPNQTTGTTMYNPTVLNIIGFDNIATPANTITQGAAALPDGVSFATNEGTFSNVSGDPYNLFVYGNIHASNFNSMCPLVFTAGKTTSMWITEEGKVGVGLPDPKASLHVGGNVIIDAGATISGATVFMDDVVFNGSVNFTADVHINGRLFVNGKEIV
jgi:hypothetical protein